MDGEEKKEALVYGHTAGRIAYILGIKHEGGRKAALARLRHGAGHEPGEMPELWGDLLTDIPAKLDGCIPAEWAIYTALTLFALHQQGNERAMHETNGGGLGAATARIALADSNREEAFERVRSRFNLVATAEDMQKLSWHLRSLVQLMRAKGVAMDYARLAKDLYLYQTPRLRTSIRMEWGRELYRTYREAFQEGEGKERKTKDD